MGSKSEHEAWRMAFGLMWPHRWLLLGSLALLFVSRAAGLSVPLSAKYAVDEALMGNRVDLLIPIACAAFAGVAIQAGSLFAVSMLLGVASQRLMFRLRQNTIRRLFRAPVDFFDRNSSGGVAARVLNDTDSVYYLLDAGLVELVGSAVTAVACVGCLFWINAGLTGILMLVLAVYATTTAVAFARIAPKFATRARLRSEIAGRLTQAFSGIRTVRAYNAVGWERSACARQVYELFQLAVSTIRTTSISRALSILCIGLACVPVMVIGGRSVIRGAMSTGDLVMYIFLMSMLVSPVVQISALGPRLVEAFAGLRRTGELLGMPVEEKGAGGKRPLPDCRGEIIFEDVRFQYDTGEPVLKGVSFRVPAGSTTALVGSSGSGKSTIINLAMGFYRPSAGRILVDGQDLNSVRLQDYRRHLGVVMQDAFLFEGTIGDNILVGDRKASEEDVLAAGRAAFCDEFAGRLERGFDSVVGERGVALSGGQRQRVAIARALLADPAILILDEATSSLDSRTEAIIQKAFAKLRRFRTTLVIAHRLATVKSADQILVVEDGQIVERGSHHELYACGGAYRELYDLQHQADLELFVNPGEELAREDAEAVH